MGMEVVAEKQSCRMSFWYCLSLLRRVVVSVAPAPSCMPLRLRVKAYCRDTVSLITSRRRVQTWGKGALNKIFTVVRESHAHTIIRRARSAWGSKLSDWTSSSVGKLSRGMVEDDCPGEGASGFNGARSVT